MKPNIPKLREWAMALRSGKYAQGQRQLRNEHNQFCCLGVACDLVDPTKWELKSLDIPHFTWDGHAALLPFEVAIAFGMNLDILSRQFGISRQYMSSLNDDGKSFSEIADIIDQYCNRCEQS